ncbi:MAG: hypothetical protein FWE82_04315 [Defluviitaleaceae bacterium]|nr:hypothetical protein [Defluviitaleaceae bacterium]
MSYIINKWALIRRGELAVIKEETPPGFLCKEEFDVHPDFLRGLSRNEFDAAFRRIGVIFFQIMTDISKKPERFAMPLYVEADTRYGAPEAQESRYAAWRPMKLLFTIFTNGKLTGRIFTVDVSAFKQANKIKNAHVLFNALGDYGFAFSGLTGGKITPKTLNFAVEFPNNHNIIKVMALVAEKAAQVNAEEFFLKWSFRLIIEPFGTFGYGSPFYAVYDKTRAPGEKEFIEAFHAAMKGRGYFFQSGGGNEGPGIRYYDKESIMKSKGPYLFQLWDCMGELRLYIRIRNAEKCLTLYSETTMPDEIEKMFELTEYGCGSRANGSCKHGIEYVFKGAARWHCGCCAAMFWLRPKAENVSHYIMLLDAGEKAGRPFNEPRSKQAASKRSERTRSQPRSRADGKESV